jgi:hypothetical protein
MQAEYSSRSQYSLAFISNLNACWNIPFRFSCSMLRTGNMGMRFGSSKYRFPIGLFSFAGEIRWPWPLFPLLVSGFARALPNPLKSPLKSTAKPDCGQEL